MTGLATNQYRPDADAEVVWQREVGIQVYATNLTAARTLLLSRVGHQNGSVFHVVRADAGAFNLTVKQESATLLTLGNQQWAIFISDGQNWRVAAVGALSVSSGGVTDGDKGDVVVSGGGTVWTVQVPVREEVIPFNDGDTYRRVNILDADVSPTSKLTIVGIRRPDLGSDADDPGYIYISNIIRVGSGDFDVLISCLGWGFDDPSGKPPNEMITLLYTVT